MPRIAGVDIPANKKIWASLTYIYGIGKTRAYEILRKATIDPEVRANKLTEEQVAGIRKIIDSDYKVEGDLKKEVSSNIKRLMDMGCYRGLRHRKGLPVRGQRTRTNSRTRKGPRQRVGTKRRGKEEGEEVKA